MAVDDRGSFLRNRRAALSPQQAGCPSHGRRRVPGLRREELAQLAGVSVAYYTRLEQGQSTNASDGVLDALARALRLDADGRAHLHNLARPPSWAQPTDEEQVASRMARLIDAMPEIATFLSSPRLDILAWNHVGRALLGWHLDFAAPADPATRPNMARQVFCDPRSRDLFVDHGGKTEETVAYLRLAAGQRPHDQQLQALIGELSMASREFATLWASATVKNKTAGLRRFDHPVVGRMDLAFQALAIPDSDGQLLVTFTAEPDTPSATALRQLGSEAAAV